MNYQELETVQRFREGSVLKMEVKPGDPVGVDYETFYDSKNKYSLRNMHPYAYVHDERFDAYMVSIATEDGQEYVGPPNLFDWESVKGALFVAHNAAFDGMVYNRTVEQGICPDVGNEWVCTADLASYLNLPRNLKGFTKALFGHEMSKAVRSDMDGKTFNDAIMAGMLDDLLNYAADDAVWCLKGWLEKGPEWPDIERQISRRNREAAWSGVHVDKAAIEAGLKTLKRVHSDASANLPWTHPENDRDYKKPGSGPAFAAHARSLGLPVPKSLRKDSPEMIDFIEKYKDENPFIQARMNYASVNTHIARLKSMVTLSDENDVMRFPLLYAGCHTGRSSGTLGGASGKQTAKFNVLNIPRKNVFGVDLRGMITPRPGYKFMIYDYAQVEPRITHWLAGNTKFLDLAKTEDIYQANAKVLGWYPMEKNSLGTDDPELRHLSKACVIGLGYGMGAAKFINTAASWGATIPPVQKELWDFTKWDKAAMTREGIDWENPDCEEVVCTFMGSVKVVRHWRGANEPVRKLWKKLDTALKQAASIKVPVHVFTLPSGRPKPYFNPHITIKPIVVMDPETGVKKNEIEKSLVASHTMGRKAEFLHGGKLTENLVQSIARDVLFYGAMDICNEVPSWKFLWNAYDEVIFEVPEQDVEDAKEVMPRCLCEGSVRKWAPGLPLKVAGGPADRYMK